eukprot:CAMPEP_0113457250 /NCGR_PEP_ID=MMETSP0014_2-20120614/9311_1 /TAXON_ID=2857 /ORGANISM="Nitzschia sp." /LENGTH=728 /DNA_ID=CAMNT_0000348739 /DNA_START=118 /DNA_END=2304 /DNA_ORIENTATION=- /assembly_acc=CAM_ASM_000159
MMLVRCGLLAVVACTLAAITPVDGFVHRHDRRHGHGHGHGHGHEGTPASSATSIRYGSPSSSLVIRQSTKSASSSSSSSSSESTASSASASGAATPNSNDSNDDEQPTSSSRSVDYEAFANGYKTVFEELPYHECVPTQGEVPTDLKGSYFRCGPAMFSAGSIAPPKTSIIQPRDGPPVPDGQNPARMVIHPFEADGGMLGITFTGGEEGQVPTSRFRYVRTVAFTNERRKGQRLYKGMDTTRQLGFGKEVAGGLGNDLHRPFYKHHLQPGLNKNRKNTSNTRAIYWGKRLLSMWEGGQPYKLDGLALQTEGRSQLGGVLEEKDPFGSKIVIDPTTNRAVFYKVIQDAKTSKLTTYEFNDSFRLVTDDNANEDDEKEQGKVTVNLPGLAMISDMAVTKNYAIVVQPPVQTNGMQFLMVKEPGKAAILEENKPSLVHLIPRLDRSGYGQKEPISFEIPLSLDGVDDDADLQFVNAYEDPDDSTRIVFDAIRMNGHSKQKSSSSSSQWPWASTKDEYQSKTAKRSLWRYTLDTNNDIVSKELLLDVQSYFGNVIPSDVTQKHRYIYMALGAEQDEVAPPQGIGKFDVETKTLDEWFPKPYEFCGEPIFAPKSSGEDQNDSSSSRSGYILSVLFNGKTEQSEMIIFDSDRPISDGPVCRIPIGLGVPHGLHGCFTAGEEACWSFEEISRRAKLSDKMESRGNMWNEVKSDFSGLGLRFDDMEEYFGDSFLS